MEIYSNRERDLSMWTKSDFNAMIDPGAIGMIHLGALPGSPRWAGNLQKILDLALFDAGALAEAGVTAVMIENYNDVPFYPHTVPHETVAAMTRLISAVRTDFPELKVGVNVLRNDVNAALAIAAATDSHFVRVNVHVGSSVTDQGSIEGQAWHTLRRRRELGIEHVGILADVRVKHARPLVQRPLAEEAQDLRLRGCADAVIVTGVATGAGADVADVAAVAAALPDCPVLVGSGMTAETAGPFMEHASGCIVGSSLKDYNADGMPVVSVAKTKEFLAALASSRA
jgi:uncharacterized protein